MIFLGLFFSRFFRLLYLDKRCISKKISCALLRRMLIGSRAGNFSHNVTVISNNNSNKGGFSPPVVSFPRCRRRRSCR